MLKLNPNLKYQKSKFYLQCETYYLLKKENLKTYFPNLVLTFILRWWSIFTLTVAKEYLHFRLTHKDEAEFFQTDLWNWRAALASLAAWTFWHPHWWDRPMENKLVFSFFGGEGGIKRRNVIVHVKVVLFCIWTIGLIEMQNCNSGKQYSINV